jgi:hypothetical protein
MSLAPISSRLRAVKSVGFFLAIMFAPLANAFVHFDIASSVNGGTSVLFLHTNGQEIGFPNRIIESIDLTYASGDGQTFHLASSVAPMLVNDFPHTFVYPNSGIFVASISGTVSGFQTDATLTGFTQNVPDNLILRQVIVVPTTTVPEPASSAMLVAGLALLAASRGRKKTNRNN